MERGKVEGKRERERVCVSHSTLACSRAEALAKGPLVDEDALEELREEARDAQLAGIRRAFRSQRDHFGLRASPTVKMAEGARKRLADEVVYAYGAKRVSVHPS